MNTEAVSIRGVPETMLQTTYARAAYSQKPGHKFYDGKAIEMAGALNYDFSKAEKDATMSGGVLARTILLDRMVRQFVDKNPSGTVVNFACGLGTRFYRVNNGSIRFAKPVQQAGNIGAWMKWKQTTRHFGNGLPSSTTR